jgi:hypothetical protein
LVPIFSSSAERYKGKRERKIWIRIKIEMKRRDEEWTDKQTDTNWLHFVVNARTLFSFLYPAPAAFHSSKGRDMFMCTSEHKHSSDLELLTGRNLFVFSSLIFRMRNPFVKYYSYYTQLCNPERKDIERNTMNHHYQHNFPFVAK